jgi:hypothetical protein
LDLARQRWGSANPHMFQSDSKLGESGIENSLADKAFTPVQIIKMGTETKLLCEKKKSNDVDGETNSAAH